MPVLTRSIKAAFVALVLISTPGMAETDTRWVYFWVDARGTEHFSDIPVEGARKILVPTRAHRQASAIKTDSAAPADGDRS